MSALVLALLILAAVYIIVWGIIPRILHRRRKGWRRYGTHVLILAVLVAGAGCTQIESPSGWKYRNSVFQKSFSELSIDVNTNGSTRVVVKGWKSDAEAVAEAVAKGVSSGLKP